MVLSDVALQFRVWVSWFRCPLYYVWFCSKHLKRFPAETLQNLWPVLAKTREIKPNQCRSALTSTDQFASVDRHIQSLDCVTTVLLYCNLSLRQSCQPGHFVCHPNHMPLLPARPANRSGKDKHAQTLILTHIPRILFAPTLRIHTWLFSQDHSWSYTPTYTNSHTVLPWLHSKELEDAVWRLKV